MLTAAARPDSSPSIVGDGIGEHDVEESLLEAQRLRTQERSQVSGVDHMTNIPELSNSGAIPGPSPQAGHGAADDRTSGARGSQIEGFGHVSRGEAAAAEPGVSRAGMRRASSGQSAPSLGLQSEGTASLAERVKPFSPGGQAQREDVARTMHRKMQPTELYTAVAAGPSQAQVLDAVENGGDPQQAGQSDQLPSGEADERQPPYNHLSNVDGGYPWEPRFGSHNENLYDFSYDDGVDSPILSDAYLPDYSGSLLDDDPFVEGLTPHVLLTSAERRCALDPSPPTVLYTPGVRPEELEALNLVAVRDEGFFELKRQDAGLLICPSRRRGERVLFRSLRLENGELVGDMVFVDPHSHLNVLQEAHPGNRGSVRREERSGSQVAESGSQTHVPRSDTEGSGGRSDGARRSYLSSVMCFISKRFCQKGAKQSQRSTREPAASQRPRRQGRLVVAQGVPLRMLHGIKPLEIFDWKVKERLYRLRRERNTEGTAGDGRLPLHSSLRPTSGENAPEVGPMTGTVFRNGTHATHSIEGGGFGENSSRLASHVPASAGARDTVNDQALPPASEPAPARRLSRNDGFEYAADPGATGARMAGAMDEAGGDWQEDFEDEPEIYIPEYLFDFPTEHSHVDSELNTLEQEATSVDLKATVVCLERGVPPLILKEWPKFLNVVKLGKGLPQRPVAPSKSSAVWGGALLAALAAGSYAGNNLVKPSSLKFDSPDERKQSFSLIGLLSLFVAGSAALAATTAWKTRTAIYSSHLRHNLREELFQDAGEHAGDSAGPFRQDFIFYYDRRFYAQQPPRKQ
ncbi:hypothetical protein BESB_012450 [Besnoitia besnoiti]|uniref:Transmembrane protein n=1 Tax=Besnoitia besnoiti TaxID=94643 RepID=A0A2A9MAC3_BESBE|nr:hypothetical protein BESB_012450 [Besnoitia besnoiti]PFH32633.1 hypothetical protein BESB_012450 [Besnoitia besnoiti]